MSQYDFDSNQEGEWEEPESTAWNEADWQNYVRKTDREVSRFITAYNKCRNEEDRLESTSKIMGWIKEDWSCIDDLELDEEQAIRNTLKKQSKRKANHKKIKKQAHKRAAKRPSNQLADHQAGQPTDRPTTQPTRQPRKQAPTSPTKQPSNQTTVRLIDCATYLATIESAHRRTSQPTIQQVSMPVSPQAGQAASAANFPTSQQTRL